MKILDAAKRSEASGKLILLQSTLLYNFPFEILNFVNGANRRDRKKAFRI
ncbi:hypothetical protein [Mucilaginibacter polytrichastri]|nr:hypothetical protein [Mucilaginibacter polytrichastri]